MTLSHDAFHVGWQSGFIDDTQPDSTERDESIMEALEKLKRTINVNSGYNYGGTK